jgi:DNA primase
MTSFIPPEKISEIQRSLNIIDIVSDYISLKQTGKKLSWFVPFSS